MKPIVFDAYHGDHISSFTDLAKTGIRLCIFKASQGLTSDSKFQTFSEQACSAGLSTGAYHFGSAGDGKKQAEYFLSKPKVGQLICLDFERYPNSQMSLVEAERFVRTCFDRTGNYPVLYYGELLLDFEAKGQVAADSILRKCPAWIARYGSIQPKPILGQDLVMWQYTGDGVGPLPHRVSGCSNDADLSVWFGNPDDIPRFVAKHAFRKVAV